MQMTVRDIALSSLLAAIYAVVSFLPGFPVVGVAGAEIEVARSLEMLYGFLLGPFLGSFTAFFGSLTGCIITGAGPFGLLRTPCALISAFVAGSASRMYVMRVKGWIPPLLLFITLIVAWYGTWVGKAIPYYPTLHYISLAILGALRSKLASFFHSEKRAELLVSIALCSYVATMAGHIFGTLIYIECVGWLFKLDSALPLLLVFILPTTAVERLTLTTISTIVSVPLVLVVRSQFASLAERTV
jgi:uncharacterized membrane protein